jgi:hypothetical protein
MAASSAPGRGRRGADQGWEVSRAGRRALVRGGYGHVDVGEQGGRPRLHGERTRQKVEPALRAQIRRRAREESHCDVQGADSHGGHAEQPAGVRVVAGLRQPLDHHLPTRSRSSRWRARCRDNWHAGFGPGVAGKGPAPQALRQRPTGATPRLTVAGNREVAGILLPAPGPLFPDVRGER